MSNKHDDNEPKADTSLGLRTKIRLDLVIILISGAFACGTLMFQIQMLRKEIQRSWTIPEQRVWKERFATQNPQLKVPDVDEVHRDMTANPN